MKSKVKLNKLFKLFIEDLAGQSANNRRNYTHRLRLFLKMFGDRPAADIMPADVNTWYQAIGSRGYQPATEAGYKQAVKAFLNWCREQGEIAINPADHLRIGSFMSKRPKLPAEVDVRACLSVATAWVKTRQPLLVRDGLIWLISYVSGCRSKEIQELRLDDVEHSLNVGPEQGVYWVRSHGKTGEVWIGYTEQVAAAFLAWLELRPTCKLNRCFIGTKPVATAKDPVKLYRPLTRSSLADCYKRVSKAAGVERPILSHALRHRKGDITTRHFGPKVAAVVLNHSDKDTGATALAFYHHPDQADANQAINNSFVDPDADAINRLFGVR
jgi:integrase